MRAFVVPPVNLLQKFRWVSLPFHTGKEMKLGEIAFERIKNWLKIGDLLYSDIIWGCMVCRFGSIGVPLQLMHNSRLLVFVVY